MKNAPSVHPDDEDEDNLPIAHEVVAVGRSNAAPVSAFDFTSMKKEMQDQMQRFNQTDIHTDIESNSTQIINSILEILI